MWVRILKAGCGVEARRHGREQLEAGVEDFVGIRRIVLDRVELRA